jgi:hypothetical protein
MNRFMNVNNSYRENDNAKKENNSNFEGKNKILNEEEEK